MSPSSQSIETIVANQRQFFGTGVTRSVAFRIDQLKILKNAIIAHEENIYEALYLDLHKSKQEAFLTEISIVIQEINLHIRKLKKWIKPKKKQTPIHLQPSSSKIIYEPLGISLIMSPWNYPVQLLLNPLVGSISAGNCAILKPSPYASHTSNVLNDIIKNTFQESYIDIVQGGREVNQRLLKERFDIIFFTGSPSLGKVVMEKASQHLTPVILELGGKSPAIVDKDANLKIAARRIAWGKTINAGQTCIAPDYLFIHQDVKEAFLKHLRSSFIELLGTDIRNSPHFARIINDNAFDRLISYLHDGSVIIGGESVKSERYISPTVIDNVDLNSNLMKDEIFGPMLPIIPFDNINKAINHINSNEKPLAFYYFGNSKQAEEILSKCTSGGGCINDTIIHIANHNLPFGGTGNSGMGSYHGKDSFNAFSHKRSIMKSNTKVDIPLRYPPYKYFEWIKRFLS